MLYLETIDYCITLGAVLLSRTCLFCLCDCLFSISHKKPIMSFVQCILSGLVSWFCSE